MARYRAILGNGIGLLIAGLYTVAGQAHFTVILTPTLAQNVDVMTHNCHAAFWFLGLDYLSLKHLFGALDLVASILLWRRKTRRAGLLMAVVGFSGGLYGQLYSGGDLLQIVLLLAAALLGLVLTP